MIEVSNVSRNFGTFRAVSDVSFSIPTGQIVGLLGPNGAGKTTTMRMITGFLKPTSGTIKIDGVSIEDAPVESKRKIGYMPEAAPLYSDMIVEDYLRYVAKIENQNPDEKVKMLCDTCGLREVMSKNIGELSRGYRQRVGLAHALMNDPEILILDEPTSGLDPNQIGDVRSLIKEIGKTRTVIISTHILGEVEMICNRVIIISGGKLVADSPTNELRERFGHAVTVRLTAGGCGAEELKAAIESVDGVESVSVSAVGDASASAGGSAGANESASGASFVGAGGLANTPTISAIVSIKEGKEIRPALCKKIAEKNWDLYEIMLQRNSLEDVFHELTSSSATAENSSAGGNGAPSEQNSPSGNTNQEAAK